MMATDAQRRTLLKALAATLCTPVLTSCKGLDDEQLLLSTSRLADGQFALCCLDTRGALRWKHVVEQRGHDVVVHPQGRQAAFFARRPGKQVWIMDVGRGRLLQQLNCEAGWHFNGHGCFSADGKTLFTTETALNPNRGQIGVWSWPDGKRVSTFSSGGLDPHQCLLSDDGTGLVVANGGIDTGNGRSKLNLTQLQSNLSYLSADNGHIQRQEHASHQQLSIRHIARLADDRVIIGMQFEGDKKLQPALVAIAGRNHGFHALPPPKKGWASMTHYIASVANDSSGRYLAATSPRGGQMVIWDSETMQCVEQQALADVAGLASLKNGFAATSGLGIVASWHSNAAMQIQRTSNSAVAWDNHATQISI
ncbi:MAG: DUF1513 domain-containing protein [Oceanococcus sp.]